MFTAASTRIEERQGHSGLATALGTMIAEALTYLPDGPAQVRCSRESVPTVRQAVASLEREGLRVSEDDTVSLGVVAESGDGAIVVNATFARRLARERPRLAIEIMGQLDRAPA